MTSKYLTGSAGWMVDEDEVTEDTRVYKIKELSTGLFYTGCTYFERGLTKAGKKRKTGPGVSKAEFNKDGCYFPKNTLNYHIKRAIIQNTKNLVEGTEIVCFDYAPVRTTLRMKNVSLRISQKVLIEKLKNPPSDYDDPF